MDFNTGGRSGRSDDRPLFGGEARRSTGGPTRGPAGEFNPQDPVNSFIATARSVVLDSVRFFRGLPRQGNFVNPLVFALICAEIALVIFGVVAIVRNVAIGIQGFLGAIGSFVFSLVYFSVFAVASFFILAGIYHLLVILTVKPASTGFETTFRVVSYSAVVALVAPVSAILALVPFIGPILSTLISIVVSAYVLFLHLVGIREMHATTTANAAIVVLVPAGVLLLLTIILGALAGSLFIASFS